MKKVELRAKIRDLERQYEDQRAETLLVRRQAEEAKAEIASLRANWRPVPMTHPWQPRNPQCALCDDPRDSPRHEPAT